MLATTALAQLLALPAPTLAESFGAASFSGGLSTLPSFKAFSAPLSLETLQIVAPVAVSIALISVLETLLARKVVAAGVRCLSMELDVRNL